MSKITRLFVIPDLGPGNLYNIDSRFRGNDKRGFTLIELLVVISILAILSIIAIPNFQNVSKNARDAKRQADLKLIQSAIEQYHGDNYNYPKVSDITFGGSFISGTKTYYNLLPKDPDPAQTYCYSALPLNCDNSTTKCTSYELFARLENPPPGSPSPICGGVSTYNLKVTSP